MASSLSDTKNGSLRPAQSDAHAILFVCTGNTCRSPMAAAWFNAHSFTDRTGAVCRAYSAGLSATGAPIAQNAVLALQNAGVPSTPANRYAFHRSHTVTEEDIRNASLVIGMTETHAALLTRLYPAFADKILSMPVDIPDPYGEPLPVYVRCLATIAIGISRLFPAVRRQEDTP